MRIDHRGAGAPVVSPVGGPVLGGVRDRSVLGVIGGRHRPQRGRVERSLPAGDGRTGGSTSRSSLVSRSATARGVGLMRRTHSSAVQGVPRRRQSGDSLAATPSGRTTGRWPSTGHLCLRRRPLPRRSERCPRADRGHVGHAHRGDYRMTGRGGTVYAFGDARFSAARRPQPARRGNGGHAQRRWVLDRRATAASFPLATPAFSVLPGTFASINPSSGWPPPGPSADTDGRALSSPASRGPGSTAEGDAIEADLAAVLSQSRRRGPRQCS